MAKRFDHVIFDFDGVIIQNSQSLLFKHCCQLLRDYNIHLSEDECFMRFLGANSKIFVDELNQSEEFQPSRPIPYDFFYGVQDRYHAELLQIGQLGHGLQDCLADLSEYSICSSNYRDNVLAMLDALHLAGYFDADRIFTAESAQRVKPAPDIYLQCLRALPHDSARVCAVEDSALGVCAAKAAGLHTFGFVTGTPPHLQQCHIEQLKQVGVDQIIFDLAELLAFA